MSSTEFTGQQLDDLIRHLGRRLSARGIRAAIYVVGGASIALGIDERRTTADVDAIFDDGAVAEEAEAMAAEFGLPKNWLNRNAAMFVPGGPDPAATHFSAEGIDVSLASPEHVLAMKMASFRPGKDMDDLELLFRHLGIEAPDQAADLALEIYGGDTVVLPGREELLLSARAILDRMGRASRGPIGS